MMKFYGSKVRDVRESRGISQKALSELSGASQATISRIESEEITNPHLSTVWPISIALKCSISDFLVTGDLEVWRLRYLDLMNWLGTHKSIFVDWCPKCGAVVNAEDDSTAKETWGDDECEVEVTYTCPKCKNVWYL